MSTSETPTQSVETVNPACGAAEQGGFFVDRHCRSDALERIPQRSVADTYFIDRKIAFEGAALSAELFDAGLDVRLPRLVLADVPVRQPAVSDRRFARLRPPSAGRDAAAVQLGQRRRQSNRPRVAGPVTRTLNQTSRDSWRDVDASGLYSEREELYAASVGGCCFLVGHAAASRVQERFAREEECGGEPVRFVLVLLVIAAQDHQPVVRDVEPCGLMSDDEVR